MTCVVNKKGVIKFMARRKNINKGIDNNNAPLTAEQTMNVLNFANQLYTSQLNGVYNPWSTHDNLISLNNTPMNYDYKQILSALNDIKNNSEMVGNYSQFMRTFDTLYSKTLNYYNSLMSFNYYIYADLKNDEEYASQEFIEDRRRFYTFMDRLDYKKEFRNVVSQILNTGRDFVWLRTTERYVNSNPLDVEEDLKVRRLPKYALQLMPQNKCKIEGRSGSAILYDIDFNYFLQPTVDIELYPPIFRQKYDEVFGGDSKTKYLPHAQYDMRNGTYATWVQTSPSEGAWCFVWDENNLNAVPPFSSLLKSVLSDDVLHELQMNKNIASAYAILYGEIETLDKQKTEQLSSVTKFFPKDLYTLLGYVQTALQKALTKTVAVPLANVKLGQYTDGNEDMESNGLATTAGQGAYGNSIIYDTEKKIQSEVINGISADCNLMGRLYPQFKNFCEYFGNMKTRKYKFHVGFDGFEFPHERKERREKIQELGDKGLVLDASAWACAYGYDAHAFECMLRAGKYGNIHDNLSLLKNINTTKDGGRPEADSTEISDGGAVSKDYE